MSRRAFLASAAATLALGADASAVEYDVLVRGGRVIDPSQRIDRVMDVAVQNGRIAAVAPQIAGATSPRVIDARGKLVLPGLVDVHAHTRPGDLPPERCLAAGVTTVVDGGSRGSDGIAEMAAIARAAPNRVRLMINVSRLGNDTAGEMLDFRNADVAAARRAVEQHRELIVGVKARLSRAQVGERDLEAIDRAHELARPLKLPIMVHIGETHSPLEAILARLDAGDIVTHVYAPPPHGILDDRGRLLPQVRGARRRGIKFDVGNGRIGHITWDVAEKALAQDFPPDTISSDLTGAGLTDRAIDLPTILSKFLLLGMPLDAVIACATANARTVIPGLPDCGTLRVGAQADITICELLEGTFEFVDNENAKRTGRRKLVTRAAFVAGVRKV